MIRKPLAAASIALALSFSFAAPLGAQAVTPAPAVSASVADDATVAEKLTALAQSSAFTPAQQAQLRSIAATLPADFESRTAARADALGLNDHGYRELANSVIDPTAYVCGPTPLQDWLDSVPFPKQADVLFAMQFLGAFDLPTYYALLFGKESKSNTFGIDGDDTNPLNRAMKQLRKFWDIDGSAIQLVPMHGGETFANRDRVAQLYQLLYGFPEAASYQVADFVIAIVMNVPEFEKGDNPYFTFNAFAYDPGDDPEAAALGLTKRIVVGDGILEGVDAIGLTEDAVPQAILAHEYGHQIQYAKGLFESTLTGPEATRRTELMADDYGTYAMVHSKGLAINAKRTLQV